IPTFVRTLECRESRFRPARPSAFPLLMPLRRGGDCGCDCSRAVAVAVLGEVAELRETFFERVGLWRIGETSHDFLGEFHRLGKPSIFYEQLNADLVLLAL